MNIITGLSIAGDEIVVENQELSTRNGIPVPVAAPATRLSIPLDPGDPVNFWTKAEGEPPTDGSVLTLFYKDTTPITGLKYVNTGTVETPEWEVI